MTTLKISGATSSRLINQSITYIYYLFDVNLLAIPLFSSPSHSNYWTENISNYELDILLILILKFTWSIYLLVYLSIDYFYNRQKHTYT